jgi:PAS domain S-box-containing protein
MNVARLFAHASESVMVLDDDAQVVDVNAATCALLGLPADELRGRRFGEFIPEQHARAWRHDWAVLRARGQVDTATVVRAATGKRRRARINAEAGLPANGNLVVLHADGAALPTRPAVADGFHLTPREREIFRLLALGSNAPEIAESLVLSVATVRTHVQNGVERIGARTRVHAVALGLMNGEFEI